MKKKIGMVSLGCPKNLVDSEIMLGHLKNEAYEIVADKEEADIIIVNTCGFIESARQESINTIIEMGQCKNDKCSLLIVTGCLAERYRHEIIAEIPEVDAVVGTGSYGEIAEIIKKADKSTDNLPEKTEKYGELSGTDYLEYERVVSTGKTSAYLKISEGCDNCCTYCVIPSLRGRFRSRRLEDIVREAEGLAAAGYKEIILVAQDTTRYGMDIYKEKRLVRLLGELGKIDGIEWIRLLYCYPEETDEELINEIVANKKVCRYFDIPIQHASPKILKMMGRRGSAEETGALLDMIREKLPDAVIRTSLIVGFPGEDEEDFEALVKFVGKYRFDRLGVFTYSKEDGTPAAKMKGQLPQKIKKQRQG
ncbi:MAG: 30S ribosomal protein S12 methylthiotransferase RimO, partial [Clostridiales bacterium]|nr:30S ribosomal protein S12 methylthiotransferase RimO [Clostridiales bacterium]